MRTGSDSARIPFVLRSSPFALAGFAALALVFSISFPADAADLPGNAAPLTIEGDLAEAMIQGIHAYLDAETAAAPEKRKQYWHYDFTSVQAYEKSIAPNRERFKRIIGADHPKPKVVRLERIGPGEHDVRLPSYKTFKLHRVRWAALDGIEAEGLLIEPSTAPRAAMVALLDVVAPATIAAQLDGVNDAEGTPTDPQEFFDAKRTDAFAAALAPSNLNQNVNLEDASGIPSSFPGQTPIYVLAQNGWLILIPRLSNLSDEYCGNPDIGRLTNQPQREFLYRMAYEMGSHLLGYEAQMVSSGAEWLRSQGNGSPLPVAVWGEGDGGLIALCAGAADPSIDVVGVSGFFEGRSRLWQEPIYRNVWSILKEFDDAGIAALIAPRAFIVESCSVPAIAGPPKPSGGRSGAAPGVRASTQDPQAVTREFSIVRDAYSKLNAAERLTLIRDGDSAAGANVLSALHSAILEKDEPLVVDDSEITGKRASCAGSDEPQFRRLVDFFQREMRLSPRVRDKFWEREMATLKDHPSPEEWEKTVEEKRRYFHEEIIGKLPDPTMAPNPRMRVVYDTPKFTGYETVLDVWPGVIASGILLVPKDLREGERRPVVVCQHGLEGRPKDTIENNNPYYEQFAAKLAGEGFITYAPQNPYIFGDKFRSIQRKANPLGLSLFSFIVGQHQQTLNWLETLPFVDPKRMAFYGLSYGGKTAMRVPAIEKRYCLSICSGDFNDWITKNCTVDSPYSYMFTGEYEMPEWNLGRTFNYAEMARLIAPRPFMVERGHFDGVAPDEWVASEYAKVKFLYDQLGIGDRTEMEYFNGPHKIHGVGTFAFLRKWLDWKKK